MIKSKALEINLAQTQVDVAIDPRYDCLQAVMASYYGLLEGLNSFLKEVSHPYKNWYFIVSGARGYALDYFHLMRTHDRGIEATGRLLEIFIQAMAAETPHAVKADAADNLILFLQKIVKSADRRYPAFAPLIDQTLTQIHRLPDDVFRLVVRSFYSLKRLARDLADLPGAAQREHTAINRLMIRAVETSTAYWLAQRDPHQWLLDDAEPSDTDSLLPSSLFDAVSHAALKSQQQHLRRITDTKNPATLQMLQSLCAMTDHDDMVQAYRQLPRKLHEAGGDNPGNLWKVLFLFHSMNLEGLALIHEDALRDINRTLNWLIANQSAYYIDNLVQKTFAILKSSVHTYPGTALNCIVNLGNGIFQTNADDLIDTFIDGVIDLGFQAPRIRGVGNDWQIQVNPAHIQNIRAWMELVELQPKKAVRLMSNLIIHLAVSGVFIRDTDLFGRDITRLLNSDIVPIYNLTKQLTRLFPVYYNDIGAEGELRDISTRIDEICHRRDPLIHFLRKQSHVEGSNRILNLMEGTLHFWATRDKSKLAAFLPPNIFALIDTDGPYVNGVNHIVKSLATSSNVKLPDLFIDTEAKQMQRMVQHVPDVTDIDRQRVVLFSEFFKQLNCKYNLDFKHLRQYATQLSADAFPKLHQLMATLEEKDLKAKISNLIDYLNLLKSIILTPDHFEIREDIYKKRHFTVDIPSMYGSYHELKFDAMGLTLRIEALINVLFEELINTIDLSFITKATCHQIHDRLRLFDRALRTDGIASAELESGLDLLSRSLEIRGFSFTQYLDIFKGFAQAVNNVINDHYNNIHGEHLTRILNTVPVDNILPKYLPQDCQLDEDKERICHRTSEIFFRDRLATSLGLQQLDLFLSRILNTLFHQSSQLPTDKLRRLLNYDPERAITPIHGHNQDAGGIIFLGNKGLNLVKLHNLGLPVPPGFIITTEVFRCREIIESYPPAQENFKEQVAHNIRFLEKATGKRFGDPAKPLLISVRSGSSISQPGMMDSFLNVGMNEKIAEGLAIGSSNPWFAWDSYRRFLQCYGMALGLSRDDFDAIIGDHKKRLGIPLKKEFSGDHMRALATSYKERIIQAGHRVPEDPIEQLHDTIGSVLDSWQSDKAKTYRRIMGISDDWGTAITVQSMVFGNLSQDAGAGVIFTHNPRWSDESLSLWGDFTVGNQGEDVVAGLVQTLPVSLKQQEIEMRDTDITLETHYPVIYQTLVQWAQDLVSNRGWSPQEIEFTFESPSAQDLHLLQTRDMAIRERKQVITFDPDPKGERITLAHGIGVSAGAMTGRLVFSLQDVAHWRRTEPETHLILVRSDTVPDDIKEIFATDGLLTARGGVTSHAAVVAHRLGKTCVVGCGNMICDERTRIVTFGDQTLRAGDHISIDGREGSVYKGTSKIKKEIA